MKKILFLMFFCIFSSILSLYAKNIQFTANDFPNDDGSAIQLTIFIDNPLVETIEIYRESIEQKSHQIHTSHIKSFSYLDEDTIQPGTQYEYHLRMIDTQGKQVGQLYSTSATAKAQWFNKKKIPLLLMMILLTGGIIYFIESAKKGKHLYIRRISGLDTIEEAVGRATELGKPLLFVPGILDLDDMQTLAGLNILGHLAERVAQYESTIHVPVCRSMVLSTAKEVVKESYLRAGRPDNYNPDSVYYLTDDQFGYVAGVDGIIMREKPAANFYLGAFYAESLILAETGFESGAIQIAGTAQPSQIPFFVAACDYTLIGEELYAASAYLSKEPAQLGSLKGQDLGKAVIILLIFLGVIFEICGYHGFKTFFTMQ